MYIALGILIGIVLVGVIRLFHLDNLIVGFDQADQLLESTLRRFKNQKAEIILPDSSPDDIADQIVNEAGVQSSNIPDV